MKVIALLPVKNEAWVLPHTLACLSAFCDVILVHDQQSTDGSREIAARFPKVVWIESRASNICEQARWQLWDIAREYDGHNLLWCTDADEVVSPPRIRAFLDRRGAILTDGVVVDALVPPTSGAIPRAIALDSASTRRIGRLSRSSTIAGVMTIARGRCLFMKNASQLGVDTVRVRAEDAPVLHLQWLLPNRSQMRQAWYRCRELLHGELSAHAINAHYAGTLPQWHVPTAPIPPEWLEGVTLPDPGVDAEATWQDADIVRWFDTPGVEFFEPLEIWHVRQLRQEFTRRTGRGPHFPSIPPSAAVTPGAVAQHSRLEGSDETADTVSRPALTVLTTPILPSAAAVSRLAASDARILKPTRPGSRARPTPGTTRSPRSVVEGLRAIGADFNFNPSSFSELARVVYAPANEALRQAIDSQAPRGRSTSSWPVQ